MDWETKSKIRDQFISYIGQEKFERFVNVLADKKLGKRQLRFWQKELWRCFIQTANLNISVKYEEIVDILKSDLERIRRKEEMNVPRSTPPFHSPTITKPTKTNEEMITDYIEFPEPFGTQFFCSDDNCPCNNTPIPPAKGYLYISPETAKFRRDCLTLDAYWAKIEKLKQRLGGHVVFVPAPGTLGTPMVLCERGAKLRNLDLKVAAADFDLWVSNKPVPCRTTPIK